MAERPILFSPPMILAILDGCKTKTRRTAKPLRRNSLLDVTAAGEQAWTDDYILDPGNRPWLLEDAGAVPGDTFWVREHYRLPKVYDNRKPSEATEGGMVWYEAGPAPAGHRGPEDFWWQGKLRPGMFMPRWASRIHLRVTDVQVERLHAITPEDALAEGVRHASLGDLVWAGMLGVPRETCPPVTAFAVLWDSIKGSGAWGANPLVWVYTFEHIKGD